MDLKSFLLLICVTNAIISVTNTVPVVKFQENGNMTSETYVRYLHEVPNLTKFTICFRMKLRQARTLNSVVSYSSKDFDKELFIGINVHHQTLEMSCCRNKFITTASLAVKIYEWKSICLAIDLEQKSYIMVQKGSVSMLSDDSQSANDVGTQLEGFGKLLLGQDQDSFGNQYNPFKSFSGEIADFFVHKEILKIEEMKRFSFCEDIAHGQTSMINFLDFKNFKFHDVSTDDLKLEDICSDEIQFFKIYSEAQIFQETQFFCKSLGGEVALPRSSKQNNDVFSLTKNSFVCDSKDTYYNDAIWLGAIVAESNETWQHFEANQEVNYTNFAETERKSLQKYRCTTLYTCHLNGSSYWDAKWMMRKCSNRRKSACYFSKIPIFDLRGLCKGSLFDRKFFISPNTQENEFQGFYYSKITLSKSITGNKKVWSIERKDMPWLRAEMERLSEFDYPMGRNNWTIFNDTCKLHSVVLKLTVCRRDEFTCDDKSCIPLRLRCDSTFDCLDESDEKDCHPVILPTGYIKEIPPPKIENKISHEVSLEVDILHILNFNVESFLVTFEMSWKISWKDPRIRFRNLKWKDEENKSNDLHDYIWIPSLTISGPLSASCDITPRFSFFTILRESDPQPFDDKYINEDYTFLGSKNTLVWNKRDTVAVYCPFDLINYPFDFQSCELNIILQDGSEEKFQLFSQGITYKGSKRLLEYEVMNVSINMGQNRETQKIVMQFRNLVTYYVANTFVPTLLMLIIGYLTFYFPIKDFNERIMVSVTALLVESSFFGEVNKNIPKTVYLKTIDIWCLFCIFVLFAITLSLSVINYARTNKNTKTKPIMAGKSTVVQVKSRIPEQDLDTKRDERSTKLNLYCRILFPVTTLTFIVWYSVSALTTLIN